MKQSFKNDENKTTIRATGEAGDLFILGIESSCDDTSAAVICNDKILANITAGQAVHAAYGGVVPELASRAHQKNIVPVIKAALDAAGIVPDQLAAIAYTKGPGLLGSLLVGSSFAKSMAQALGVAAIPVHHMKAHVLAHFIEGLKKPSFPFLCMTISGGHTQILTVHGPNQFEIIGETLDDAAGEAFDKAAKSMGLPYPGGQEIDRLAKTGNPLAFSFTKPKVAPYHFSFSGLKTNFINFLIRESRRNTDFITENLADLCASIQHTIVEILLEQLLAVVEKTGIRSVALAGGVSANSYLKLMLESEAKNKRLELFIPPLEYCTDNGAMIAIAGYFEFLANREYSLSERAAARWAIDE